MDLSIHFFVFIFIQIFYNLQKIKYNCTDQVLFLPHGPYRGKLKIILHMELVCII